MQDLLKRLAGDSFNIGIIVADNAKKIIWANEEARELVGEAIVGHRLGKVMPWLDEDCQTKKMAFWNGKAILVEVGTMPGEEIPGGTVVCTIDLHRYLSAVTGDDRATILFGLETILDALDESIYIVDPDGILIFCNAASEKQDDMTKEQMIGKHICDSWVLDETNSVLLRVFKTKQPETGFRHTYQTVFGKSIEAFSHAYPLYEGDQFIGVVSVTNHTSKIHQAYEKLVELQGTISSGRNSGSVGSGTVTLSDIVGSDPGLKQAIDWARRAAVTQSPVMICGETGTGKELFAHGIHQVGRRNLGPFLPVNCSAIPDTLLESILFGTVKGAYTGAVDRPGLFEQASNGTIFLDEINSMSLQLQSKLLRILEDGMVRRVGDVHEIRVEPKIISAINVHPLDAIQEGTLRKDLFYRLAAVFIEIPPLRDRTADIDLLIAHFIPKHCHRFGRPIKQISPKVIKAFKEYNWPGNVRELEHCIENALNVSPEGSAIELEHLPSYFRHSETGEQVGLNLTMQAYEKKILLDTIAKTRGNVTHAAGILGITRQGLEYKLRKHDISSRKRKT